MNMECITFRSITPAQRGQRVLRQGGLMVSLQRTPRIMGQQGCGYCLKIRRADREKAVAMLNNAGIQFQNIYTADGGRVAL